MANQFLKFFSLFSNRYTAKKIEATPQPILDDEEFSRFIFAGGQLYADGRPKHSAFLPARDLKTSVFRKSRMRKHKYEETKLIVTALRQKKEPKKKLLGSAIISFRSVAKAGLEATPEESELQWHADLINWPTEKQKQKSIAQELARQSTSE